MWCDTQWLNGNRNPKASAATAFQCSVLVVIYSFNRRPIRWNIVTTPLSLAWSFTSGAPIFHAGMMLAILRKHVPSYWLSENQLGVVEKNSSNLTITFGSALISNMISLDWMVRAVFMFFFVLIIFRDSIFRSEQEIFWPLFQSTMEIALLILLVLIRYQRNKTAKIMNCTYRTEKFMLWGSTT